LTEVTVQKGNPKRADHTPEEGGFLPPVGDQDQRGGQKVDLLSQAQGHGDRDHRPRGDGAVNWLTSRGLDTIPTQFNDRSAGSSANVPRPTKGAWLTVAVAMSGSAL